MKKIIFFSKNLKIGGMEKALVSLLNSLSTKYNITLVLEEKSGTLLDDLNREIIVEEYKLSKSKVIIFRKVINLIKRLLWKIKNKNKYIFSCNYATYSIIGSRLAQVASVNSAYYIHSDYYSVYNGNPDKIKEFFAPHHLSKYKKIIFVSNESKNLLLKIYPQYKEKSFVINNIVSYNSVVALSYKKVDTIISSDDINLLFVGRLDNLSKNFDLLLDSFSLVVKRNSCYKLYIVGDGAYKSAIKSLIAQKHLKSNVFLLGEQKNPYPFMRACDAIIFTSNYEGFPVTFLEALVLNKLILTTVIMSDESIDIAKYAIVLKRNAELIANEIVKSVKSQSKIKIDLDFDKLNQKKLEMMENLIEV